MDPICIDPDDARIERRCEGVESLVLYCLPYGGLSCDELVGGLGKGLSCTDREQSREKEYPGAHAGLQKGGLACPPPNGSRLSCGRPARRRKSSGRTVRAPPGAQHSASFKTISARQLQALVRRPARIGNGLLRVILTTVPRFVKGHEVAGLGLDPPAITFVVTIRRPRY